MNKREIVISVETTGLNPEEGHRVVEVATLELKDHEPTGRQWHQIINPERSVPAFATEVHGLDDMSVQGAPTFAAVASNFLEFLGGAPLIAHYAPFHSRFLDGELERANLGPIAHGRVTDLMHLCTKRYPGQPRSLGSMCEALGVDLEARSGPTALGDVELAGEVYRRLLGA